MKDERPAQAPEGSPPQINGTAASEEEPPGPAREVDNGQSAEEYERLLLQRLRASDSHALDELVDELGSEVDAWSIEAGRRTLERSEW
jgi:hypothetical protein